MQQAATVYPHKERLDTQKTNWWGIWLDDGNSLATIRSLQDNPLKAQGIG